MRAIPVLLVALLVFASVGVGTQGVTNGSSPQHAAGAVAQTSGHNATDAIRVLSLNESQGVTADVDVVTIEASTATDFGANTSAAEIETIALRERIEAANTSDERQRRILDGLNEVEKDVITLRSDRREAITRYSTGEITARQLLVELAEVRASAQILTDRLRVISEFSEEAEDFSVDGNRVARLEFDLRTFDGPVRSRVGNALIGERSSSTQVFVAATESGVTLATVADGRYVRETFRADLRNRGSGIDEVTAQNVTARSYPEISNESGVETATIGSGGTFISTFTHTNGTLTAFVDGGSKQVFIEHQQIELTGVTPGPAESRTLDLRLHVNRTFPGGPLRVAVLDPNTGEPVDAVVKIKPENQQSTDVGTTGDDGVLWTVSPRGEFVVTVVEVGSTDVSTVSVTPSEPVTVADALASTNGSRSADIEPVD